MGLSARGLANFTLLSFVNSPQATGQTYILYLWGYPQGDQQILYYSHLWTVHVGTCQISHTRIVCVGSPQQASQTYLLLWHLATQGDQPTIVQFGPQPRACGSELCVSISYEKNGKRAMLKGNKLKIEQEVYDVEFCRRNLKKEETRGTERRRSWSMGQNGDRSISQERRGENRNRSLSPGADTWRQREQQPEKETRARNVVMTQAEATAGCVNRQEVTYRSDELGRVDDVWRSGNKKDNVRQAKSPVLGNMQRQNRSGNDMGGYFFRSGTNRRK